MAQVGGEIAKNTRDDIEKKLGKGVVTRDNSLKYQYIGDDKQIEKR